MMISSNTPSGAFYKPSEPTSQGSKDAPETRQSSNSGSTSMPGAAPGVITFVAEAKQTIKDTFRAITQMRLAIQPTLLMALMLRYHEHNMPFDTVITTSRLKSMPKLDETDCIFTVFYSWDRYIFYANYPTLVEIPDTTVDSTADSRPGPTTRASAKPAKELVYRWKLVTVKLREYALDGWMELQDAFPITSALLAVSTHQRRIQERYKEKAVVQYLTAVDRISTPRPKPGGKGDSLGKSLPTLSKTRCSLLPAAA